MIWLLSVLWMAPTRYLLVFCFFTSSHFLGGKAKETHHARHGNKLWQIKTTGQKGNDYMTSFPTHLKVTVNVSAPVQLDKPMTVACIANMVISRSKFLQLKNFDRRNLRTGVSSRCPVQKEPKHLLLQLGMMVAELGNSSIHLRTNIFLN